MPSPEEGGLLIVCGVWDGRGGLQQHLGALVDDVAAQRPVTVLTWGRPGRTVEGGATVVRLPTPWPWTGELSKWRGRLNVAAALCTGVPVALALRRRWTVAFAAGLDPEALVAVPAARLGRRRAVARTWLTGPWGNVARLRRSVAGALILRLLRRTVVVAETDEAAHELVAAGFDQQRVRIVHHGTDLDRWRVVSPSERVAARRRLGVDDAAGVVAYCGRFDLRQKRLDVLLAGWRAAAVAGWRLVIAGEGPDAGTVRKLAEGLDPAAVLLPWQADARSVLAAADAFVLPTDAETTGQAMLEGLAMGLPGIVSATPSLRARRPDGVVLVANDATAWSAALSAMADSDADGRARRGAEGRAWVKAHHDVRRQMAELRAVLGL